MVTEAKGTKLYRKIIKEEHVVLVQERGSKYIGHISPTSSTTNNTASEMLSYFQNSNIEISKLKPIGCNGTAVSTGSKSGIIKILESKSGIIKILESR